MNKKEILKEIFELEGYSTKIDCDRYPITSEEFLSILSKTNYSLAKEMPTHHSTTANFLKRIFPDRVSSNTKVDNWLLSKFAYKECKSCKEVKEEEEFSLNKSRPDGLNTFCKLCVVKNSTGYQREYQKRRKALKLFRVPKWADLDKIKEIYDTCPKGFHVDHIVPLQGKLVSGLHVEYNLQHLPAKDNLIKNNKFEV